MSEGPAKLWTVDETKALLTFYRARKQELLNHRKKRMAYAHILEDMIAAGFDPTIEVVHLKFKMTTLMRAYKAAKDNAKSSGVSPCTAPFMDEMDDLFGDKHINSEREAFNAGAENLFADLETDTGSSWPTTRNTPAHLIASVDFSTDSTDSPTTSRAPVAYHMSSTKRAKMSCSDYFLKRLEQKEREQEEVARRWEIEHKANTEYRRKKLEMLKKLINKSNEN